MDANRDTGRRLVAPRPVPCLLGVPVPARAFGAALTWSVVAVEEVPERPHLTVISGDLAA